MKKFFVFVFSLLILSGCNFQPIFRFIEPVPDLPEENLNMTEDDYENMPDLVLYTLELGRTDPDIQSQKTYTFYLPSDVEYEVMGIDAPSTLLEFKKNDQVIFSWQNRDYVVDEDSFDIMYPEWYNYSFNGGHTNVLFFDEFNGTDYEDYLYIFEDSLKINGQLVF